jgi:hypothetical protein
MQKLILISILFANVWIPVRASREPNAMVGLKKTLLYMVVFNAVYLLLVMFAYPRM